jgi:predicted nucleic acid-binding protein
MMNGGGSQILVDTNVLVYASQQTAPLHGIAFGRLQSLHDQGNELWLSQQILREYLATMSRSQIFANPLPAAILAADIARFQTSFRVAEDSAQVMAKLLVLIQQVSVGGKQVHDANIVATMMMHGIDQLLTHNVDDFRRFARYITILPLIATP